MVAQIFLNTAPTVAQTLLSFFTLPKSMKAMKAAQKAAAAPAPKPMKSMSAMKVAQKAAAAPAPKPMKAMKVIQQAFFDCFWHSSFFV